MQPKTKPGVSWLRVGYILLAALAMYFLVTHLSDFKGSLSELKYSQRKFDAIAVVAVAASYSLSALTYYYISIKPLKYLRTVVVELAVNVLNRLLPAGIGGLGANYVYLTRSKHSKAQAGAVIAANTILGIVGNLLLLGVLLIFSPNKHFRYSSLSPKLVTTTLIIVVALVLLVSAVPKLRRKIRINARAILKNLKHYRFLKRRLSYGLLCQIGLTLANVLAFYFSLRAVHGSLPIGSMMLAYSFAIWVGTVIPAPGGVGSVDAGLVAGLLAFKVSLAQAVATVLIFRLLSFWLPLILGVIPLIWSYRKGYL